jgi:hypothetical protein
MGRQCWLVQRLDIRLLTDAVAAMTDPLPAAVGTGDHFAAIIFLNISGSADEARPPRSRSPSHRAIPATPEARRYPPEGTPQPALARKPTDRTSKSAVPTLDPTRCRHGCSGPHRPPPSRSPHGCERCILPMDAKDKGPYAPRSDGRSVVALYNRRRPHSSLDGTTPDHAYFTSLPLRMAA